MRTLLFLASVILILSACGPLPSPSSPGSADTGTPEPGVGNPLAGTEWVLTTLNGDVPLEGTQITLKFQEDTVGGSAGCNSYGAGPDDGGYTAGADGALEIPLVGRTLMACLEPAGIMEQEDAYLEGLTSAASYRMADNRLEIQNKAGETVLVFARRDAVTMDPAELEGSAWQLVAMNGGEPIEGSAITLAFHGGGRASGHSGCRDYVMLFEVDAARLSFFYTGMLGPVCDDEARLVQEGDYTSIFTWVDRYILVDGRLELQSVRGETLTYEPLPANAQPPLEGTGWMLLGFIEDNTGGDGGTAAVPTRDLLAGTEISLTLSGGQVTGNAGCNTYGGGYTLQSGALVVTDLYQTEMACMDPEGVMDQESRYLDLLQDATQANVYGAQLWLETQDGHGLVFRAGG